MHHPEGGQGVLDPPVGPTTIEEPASEVHDPACSSSPGIERMCEAYVQRSTAQAVAQARAEILEYVDKTVQDAVRILREELRQELLAEGVGMAEAAIFKRVIFEEVDSSSEFTFDVGDGEASPESKKKCQPDEFGILGAYNIGTGATPHIEIVAPSDFPSPAPLTEQNVQAMAAAVSNVRNSTKSGPALDASMPRGAWMMDSERPAMEQSSGSEDATGASSAGQAVPDSAFVPGSVSLCDAPISSAATSRRGSKSSVLSSCLVDAKEISLPITRMTPIPTAVPDCARRRWSAPDIADPTARMAPIPTAGPEGVRRRRSVPDIAERVLAMQAFSSEPNPNAQASLAAHSGRRMPLQSALKPAGSMSPFEHSGPGSGRGLGASALPLEQ